MTYLLVSKTVKRQVVSANNFL